MFARVLLRFLCEITSRKDERNGISI